MEVDVLPVRHDNVVPADIEIRARDMTENRDARGAGFHEGDRDFPPDRARVHVADDVWTSHEWLLSEFLVRLGTDRRGLRRGQVALADLPDR